MMLQQLHHEWLLITQILKAVKGCLGRLPMQFLLAASLEAVTNDQGNLRLL